MQVFAAVRALHDAGYIEASLTMGWSDGHASGAIVKVHERARRELGTWPSADTIVTQLALALADASESEPEPERKGRLKAASATVGGIGRDVLEHYFERKLGL